MQTLFAILMGMNFKFLVNFSFVCVQFWNIFLKCPTICLTMFIAVDNKFIAPFQSRLAYIPQHKRSADPCSYCRNHRQLTEKNVQIDCYYQQK